MTSQSRHPQLAVQAIDRNTFYPAADAEKPDSAVLKGYRKNQFHKVLIITGIMVMIVFCALVSITIGPMDITLMDIGRIVTRHLTSGSAGVAMDPFEAVLWQVRVPRMLTALVVGFGLAVAGAVMQPVLRNVMASPFTLGISSGAGFGAALAIVFGKSIGSGTFQVVTNAFLFSLVSAFLILALSRAKAVTPEMMILIGVALSHLFTAATTMIQYFADSWATEEIVFWMVGSLSRGSWEALSYICPVMLICVPLLIYKSGDLNAITAGDDAARSIGVNVDRTRILLMVVASLVTATVICFTGGIGFVGLVAPHITRLVGGGDNRYVIPAAGLTGALLMLVSDMVAMNILKPVIIPIGVMTSLMGVPLFIYLIIRMKRGYFS